MKNTLKCGGINKKLIKISGGQTFQFAVIPSQNFLFTLYTASFKLKSFKYSLINKNIAIVLVDIRV